MFSERLRQYRKSVGLSQLELARLLNVAQSSVTAWETGKNMPNAEKLQLLADLFATTVDELLGKEQNNKPVTLSNDELTEEFKGMFSHMTQEQKQKMILELIRLKVSTRGQ